MGSGVQFMLQHHLCANGMILVAHLIHHPEGGGEPNELQHPCLKSLSPPSHTHMVFTSDLQLHR